MKILVPVDGSAYSLKAVETACDLAKAQAPATLVLTAVAIQIPELEEGVYIAEKMKAQAEIALAKAKEVAQGKGVTAEMILAIGASPVDEIVQVARDQLVDLIVIGSRGLAGKTRSFLGSTASQVVTYSPCSVLVVKTQD
ncbi:MAG: universal stress protein [Desulfobacterales bacterium]|nr:universal stress protein [Pseudomonadota bacterium]MBU4355835.1 universal stress protein [Pseudomonadota bacterium]MCG2773639.1 universal stress protein [Desulfobacterales bacterium]